MLEMGASRGDGKSGGEGGDIELPLEQLRPVAPAAVAGAGAKEEGKGGSVEELPPWEYRLRKYLMLLATVVATVTYTAALSPPGGVWQEGDPAAEHLAGDAILRDTHLPRYSWFFYLNAGAFASSLVTVVLILILSVVREREKDNANRLKKPLLFLRGFMVLDLLSLIGAYTIGTYRDRDRNMVVYNLVLASVTVVYMVLPILVSGDKHKQQEEDKDDKKPTVVSVFLKNIRRRKHEKACKVLLLLATFAVSVTYLAGLNAPGGFWDHAEAGGRPGEPVLRGPRPMAFVYLNSTAFFCSLLIAVQLLDKNLRRPEDKVRFRLLCIFSILALFGLLGAYCTGSTRGKDTVIYGVVLVVAPLIITCSILLKVRRHDRTPAITAKGVSKVNHATKTAQAMEKARSLVLLLATLAATITYQAALDPPGGVWDMDGAGHKAGYPILLTTSPRRYKAFFYCNSVAFVASLVAIVLANISFLHQYHALEVAMILDLLGLIGAYAAGACRDVSTSIYAMALAGAVLVYVVIHIIVFTLHHDERGNNLEEEKEKEKKALMDEALGNWRNSRFVLAILAANEKEEKKKKALMDEALENRRKSLLLFAILAATITYQAGLTPAGGFRLRDDSFGDDSFGHHAGDPVLLYNSPRRYHAFFYCNSLSFMLSIALILLLVNPKIYKPAIQTHALSICTAAGMFSLVGAYAAGSTQHFRTSIKIFGLVALLLIIPALAVLIFVIRSNPKNNGDGGNNKVRRRRNINKQDHKKQKYLMLLGILGASVTYQVGLKPPGGVWQSNGTGHIAGNPVMHDNGRARYLAFFYINSTSFVASVIAIIIVLLEYLFQVNLQCSLIEATAIVFGLLFAYAVGSSRSWETTTHVLALVIAVLLYIALHLVMSSYLIRRDGNHIDPSKKNKHVAASCVSVV